MDDLSFRAAVSIALGTRRVFVKEGAAVEADEKEDAAQQCV